MKKLIILAVILLLLVTTILFWISGSDMTWDFQSVIMLAGLLIVLGFAVFIGVQRARSIHKKEPTDDEFTRKIMTRASSLSFYISIYFWLVMAYISDKVDLETHTLINAGILGMALIFFFSWLGVKIYGLRNG